MRKPELQSPFSHFPPSSLQLPSLVSLHKKNIHDAGSRDGLQGMACVVAELFTRAIVVEFYFADLNITNGNLSCGYHSLEHALGRSANVGMLN